MLKNGSGCALPVDFTNLVRGRGCVILRNVVPVEQAEAWETEIKDYSKRQGSPRCRGQPSRPTGELKPMVDQASGTNPKSLTSDGSNELRVSAVARLRL